MQATTRLTDTTPNTWVKESIERILDPFQNIPTTKPPSTQEISLEITHQDFRKAFRKWKERTSSSPSGRHLGHYKAILDCEIKTDYRCIMCSLPLKYGFAPKRWSNGIKFMLEKDVGRPRIDHLRVIHLLEADYNFVLNSYGEGDSSKGQHNSGPLCRRNRQGQAI